MSRNFCPVAFSFWALLVLFREAAPKALPPLNLSDVCGTRPLMKNTAAGTRIVGGHDAMLGAWPWNPAIWRAVIGLHNLNEDNSHTIKRRIKAINIHPNYVADTYDNDIALIILVRSIRFNDYVHPICLPATNLLKNQQYPCYISGWGKTKEKGESNLILQEAQVDIIPQKICNKLSWYGGTITLNMVCAGFPAGGVDSCQGDSGGPLTCYFPTTTKFYLIGITSFGYGCGRPRYPGVYVRTINYINWINKYLKSKIVTVELHCLFIFLIVWWTVFHIL
ncbi:transmembrane protease serine 12-like isoform X3 [Pantherophis guttatus]|uniref:Transmembrane protease serine 12-like isoform X3 n=1 Tax=Pantherophis guttatus TaxID=94885 RepID=A0A6P9BAM1_PANGU|nr:transmembrane protease serine 12-like isoform X3 [Pantherophis guttatus]